MELNEVNLKNRGGKNEREESVRERKGEREWRDESSKYFYLFIIIINY